MSCNAGGSALELGAALIPPSLEGHLKPLGTCGGLLCGMFSGPAARWLS